MKYIYSNGILAEWIIGFTIDNVVNKDIFRPAVWSKFGTKENEGEDFRACED